MISLELTDSVATLILPILEVPLTQDTIENATDVQTLDFNVYTDFINQKRQWTHTWAYMSLADYNALRAFYDRQFTTYEYPTLSISYYSISGVVVRMSINQKDIISNCGEIRNVTVTFRETAQLPVVS